MTVKERKVPQFFSVCVCVRFFFPFVRSIIKIRHSSFVLIFSNIGPLKLHFILRGVRAITLGVAVIHSVPCGTSIIYQGSYIYSLDWIPDPRCVLLSFDDGTMRLLSLTKAASDAPVTGKPFAGTKQQGLHNLGCLPFAIWSVQVSRLKTTCLKLLFSLLVFVFIEIEIE